MDSTINSALDSLTDIDVTLAAKEALAASGLGKAARAKGVAVVEASLRWAIGAIRAAPTEDLVEGSPWGGRGLRQEVWQEFDEARDGIEQKLRVIILWDRGDDRKTCTTEAHSDAWLACHEIMEDAADHLFGPLANAIAGGQITIDGLNCFPE